MLLRLRTTDLRDLVGRDRYSLPWSSGYGTHQQLTFTSFNTGFSQRRDVRDGRLALRAMPKRKAVADIRAIALAIPHQKPWPLDLLTEQHFIMEKQS